jgi:uroporphyrinogen-III decarboxylase
MTYRDEFLQAVTLKPGKIPIDFGGSSVCGMHVSIVDGLRRHYGLPEQPIRVYEPGQMLGILGDDLKEILGVGTIFVPGPRTIFGFPQEEWKEWLTPWGQTVSVPGKFVTNSDESGAVYIYPDGDTTVPPSGKMPASGYFFDSIVRNATSIDDNPRLEDNLEEFQIVSDADLMYYRKALETAKNSGRFINIVVGSTSPGNVAMLPASFMKNPRGLRDLTDWYMALVAMPEYVRSIFDHQAGIALENLKRVHSVVGNTVDAIYLCGTDFGTQQSLFFSLSVFDDLFAPFYKRLNSWIHENTSWKVFKHSCGAIEPLIGRFIEVGFDLLNPVQTTAVGMDAKNLKKKYGDRLVFWGGGVDTQKILPFGTPEQVRREVLENCAIFGLNGGFVFSSVHNIQAKTPIDNVVAMFEAVKEYNGR